MFSRGIGYLVAQRDCHDNPEERAPLPSDETGICPALARHAGKAVSRIMRGVGMAFRAQDRANDMQEGDDAGLP